MHDYLMAEDSELWDIILDGPFVPTRTNTETEKLEVKPTKEYTETDRKAIEKGLKVKKILICGIEPDEYNCVSSHETAKEIWEAFLTAHEGTSQVKQSKIDMLTTEYELFRMKDDESIQDTNTRFTSIINELHSLGEIISIVPHLLTVFCLREQIRNLVLYLFFSGLLVFISVTIM
ncbi:uncharacterized protein LOC132637139 [Lycium barbarum]|uniref:uncharacterized protein LOC132637139 n=1 Tax=Lycium barbarum TaxID=112863 RepID=UPI00293EB7E3|nr:uncharacterized protein LOC132637139 [Lycium barbarum]